MSLELESSPTRSASWQVDDILTGSMHSGAERKTNRQWIGKEMHEARPGMISLPPSYRQPSGEGYERTSTLR